MNNALIESLLPLVPSTSHRLAPMLPPDDREEMEAVMRLELCERMEQYDAERGAAKSFAIGALRNAGRQWLDREGKYRQRNWLSHRENQPDTVTPGPEAATLAADAQHRAVMGLNDLPPKQQALLRMRFWDEATVREMGHRLGISKTTAARLYNEGIRRLSDTIQ